MNQDLCKEHLIATPAKNGSSIAPDNEAVQDGMLPVSPEFQKESLLHYGDFEYDQVAKRLTCSPGVYHLFGLPQPLPGKEKDAACLIKRLNEREQTLLWSLLHKEALHQQQFEQSFVLDSPTTGEPQTILVRGVYLQVHGAKKVIGLMANITKQKKIEEDTRMHILELERSNNDLEGFAYVASHDLQEPLRKIVTFSDMLLTRQGKLGNVEKDYLSRIHKSAYDMRALIDNLLDYSHIGQTDAPSRVLSLNFILQQSLSDLEVKLNAVQPVLDIGPLPELRVNPERIRRVFTNLLGNALKFGKKNQQLRIRIYASPVSKEETAALLPGATMPYTRITIEDNGIGFEKEYEQRIFQIFQRLHGRSSYPGSGIGLAICKKIIEQHRGYIYSEGEKGVGARFHILLPLVVHED